MWDCLCPRPPVLQKLFSIGVFILNLVLGRARGVQEVRGRHGRGPQVPTEAGHGQPLGQDGQRGGQHQDQAQHGRPHVLLHRQVRGPGVLRELHSHFEDDEAEIKATDRNSNARVQRNFYRFREMLKNEDD